MLEALGVSGTAELVYLALLECPNLDFQDLVRCLDLTERDVHEAVDELIRMALLDTAGGAQGTPRLIDPEAGLAALVARQQAGLARRQQEIEEGRLALLSKIADFYTKPVEPGIERIEGMGTISRRFRELAVSSELEVCAFVPGGAQSATSLQICRVLDADLIDRGVRLRAIYLDSARNDNPTLEYVHWLCDLGMEVRTVPTLPLRMWIADRKLAVVLENPDDGDAAATVVSNGGIVAALYTLFASVWRSAKPLRSRRSRDEEGLSAQGREVLKLLGSGCTDELVARRLGVSVRTARRVAADLFARLGAQSRFQAGALALARGWIDVDDLVS